MFSTVTNSIYSFFQPQMHLVSQGPTKIMEIFSEKIKSQPAHAGRDLLCLSLLVSTSIILYQTSNKKSGFDKWFYVASSLGCLAFSTFVAYKFFLEASVQFQDEDNLCLYCTDTYSKSDFPYEVVGLDKGGILTGPEASFAYCKYLGVCLGKTIEDICS